MERFWWQLPGPSRFVDAVEYDLRDGRSVILKLPQHQPAGLREAIGDRVRRNELWSFRTLDLTGNDSAPESPLSYLHRRYASQADSPLLPSVQSLVKSEAFRGMVIWLSGMDATCWGSWWAFLVEYEHACRSLPEPERVLFCIPLVAPLSTIDVKEQVAIASRQLRGFVDRLDMTLLLSHLFHNKRMPWLYRRLMVAIGTELATTDPQLACELAQADLRLMLDPLQLLKRLALARDWTADQAAAPDWARGMVDDLDGEPVVHSAVLAVNGGNGQINRRIWRGQVGVLFPFIEERRLDLLDELKRHLTVPFQTCFGTITDMRDLELGHMLYQVRGVRLPQRTARQLRCLKDCRDCLAHMEPVSSDLLGTLLTFV
jgi:hypothetical protein